jgi:hypothetical protein
VYIEKKGERMGRGRGAGKKRKTLYYYIIYSKTLIKKEA